MIITIDSTGDLHRIIASYLVNIHHGIGYYDIEGKELKSPDNDFMTYQLGDIKYKPCMRFIMVNIHKSILNFDIKEVEETFNKMNKWEKGSDELIVSLPIHINELVKVDSTKAVAFKSVECFRQHYIPAICDYINNTPIGDDFHILFNVEPFEKLPEENADISSDENMEITNAFKEFSLLFVIPK